MQCICSSPNSEDVVCETKRELSRRRWRVESARMLCAAAGAGDCGLVQALIKVVPPSSADDDEKAARHRRRFVRSGRNRALRMAAANGRTRCLALLLLHGADAEADSHQALCSAARGGHVDTVSLLLDEGGADVGARGWYPLRQSLWRGHGSVAEELLRRVPERRNCTSSLPSWERRTFTPFDSVFRQAVRAGDERLLRVLIRKDIPLVPCDGLLMDVARHDRLHMLRILTDELLVPSGRYDATTVYDMALERVVSYGTVGAADRLVEWGATFRGGGGGKTREDALTECVVRGHDRAEMARWLIERAGADVRFCRDPTNCLPLLGWCVASDHDDDALLLELLVRSGADVHEPLLDANGSACVYGIRCMDGPVHCAVMDNRPNCVRRLLDWGSDVGVARRALETKRRIIDRYVAKKESSSFVQTEEAALHRMERVLEEWSSGS